ncbi:AfsR/SARP family transcriptional regulator [Nocardioides taihuensis]|uniref:BTAD domain-containing putative transcriptional regulator n=1 Tax=Nocardioides taihuensis TaxID=1835606 RepID=A0ABW0BPX1_9ACTN
MGHEREPGRDDVSLVVQLLGQPAITRDGDEAYQPRSRKTWCVLAYLLLCQRPPTRAQLSSLLFSGADDPARALRWSLTEIRRALGPGATVDGDPVVLRLPDHAVVDASLLTRGAWLEAVDLPGLGLDLLEGTSVRDAPGYDAWLLAQQSHLRAAGEAVLHEAALGSMAVCQLDTALRHATRLVTLDPLDEGHQALLIRLYRMTGDDDAAARQLASVRELFDRELGVEPGDVVERAGRAGRQDSATAADTASVDALLEAGSAAISAGAHDAGMAALTAAVAQADATGDAVRRVAARVALAETCIHALRGLDEEGLPRLFEADRIAHDHGLRQGVADARSELGYVDFLRGRYDRAERWLGEALVYAGGAVAPTARALAYLGSVVSDQADYPRAVGLLAESVALAEEAGEPRRAAYALSMLGRVAMLRGDTAEAATQLDRSIAVAEADRWLALLPWPQALRGELHLLAGDRDAGAAMIEQAFARACQLGDPCWEGTATRARALVAEDAGDADEAFRLLGEARVRANRLADPYVWLDGHLLDTLCTLGRRHGHPDTRAWAEALRGVAARGGMRELVVRCALHRAALGEPGEADAAAVIAAEIDNPVLARLVEAALPVGGTT